MPAFLAPLIMGAGAGLAGWLGYKGQRDTNRANENIMRQNMEFQERMSSTAIERAMDDYRRAGLNPALAYGHSASSPTGASAVIGNALNAGTASARDYLSVKQGLSIAKQQSEADLRLKRTNEEYLKAQGRSVNMDTELKLQQYANNAITQPYQQRLAAAETMLRELLLPGAKNTADFETLLGRLKPGIASAKTAAEILKLISGIVR